VTLFLVRHGRPMLDPARPAHEWELDPASYDDVWALRSSGRLPARAAWVSSPEPKAQQTAQLLTDGRVGIVDELREHLRGPGWVDDFEAAVRRAFDQPEIAAVEWWEPLSACRDRVLPVVRRILEVHGDQDVVLVRHGTAWTVVVAELTGQGPDLDAWRALAMPDVIAVSI